MAAKTLPALSVVMITGPECGTEGPMLGVPAVVVHASNGAAPAMSTAAVMAEVHRLSMPAPCTVSIAGCDPGAQPFGELAEMLQRQGYTVQVRTPGTSPAGWFGAVDYVDIAPPPPSAGITVSTAALDRTVGLALSGQAQVSLVLTVADSADYTYARAVAARHDPLPVFLHPAETDHQTDGGFVDLRTLMEWVCADRWYAARVLPAIPTS